ncbi:MAG TPA: DUF2141 domain-containing protein [Polyangiaceae bacterium]|nr:DUF2141 domain-containing protein [Polyangiaceae bacterium]
MTRSYPVFLLTFGALGLLLPSSSFAGDEPSTLNVVEFKMQASSNKGVVRCGLFARTGWLKKPLRTATATPSAGSALCVFDKVPAGTLGISAFHDENSNGKLDTNFVGMPVEDYCASRDARGTFGPPSFDDAKFDYRGGTKRLSARLK